MKHVGFERWARFQKHRLAFASLIILVAVFGLSLFSEIICNNRPLVLGWNGKTYFPLFHRYDPEIFGETTSIETDFKSFTSKPEFKSRGNWALFPPIPFGPNESLRELPSHPPSHPTTRNLLGTDDRGRDLCARLLYGFRNSLLFALVSWAMITLLAFIVGGIGGFFGGRIDFLIQRLTEIWSALPLLYVVVFLLAIVNSGLILLAAIWVAFNWISLSSYIRAEVLRVRNLDFVSAAIATGSPTHRILLRHILPNTLTPIVTFAPFLIGSAIASLAALDYLGLGLPPPTPSWGELLRQGKENIASWWLSLFPFFSLFLTLLGLNFIGEGVRDAFEARG